MYLSSGVSHATCRLVHPSYFLLCPIPLLLDPLEATRSRLVSDGSGTVPRLGGYGAKEVPGYDSLISFAERGAAPARSDFILFGRAVWQQWIAFVSFAKMEWDYFFLTIVLILFIFIEAYFHNSK